MQREVFCTISQCAPVVFAERNGYLMLVLGNKSREANEKVKAVTLHKSVIKNTVVPINYLIINFPGFLVATYNVH